MSEEKTGEALRFFKNAEGLMVAVMLAVILWLGNTTYNNSLVLARVETQVETLVEDLSESTEKNTMLLTNLRQHTTEEIDRIDGHLDSIWPRLREMKERIQYLESLIKDNARANSSWKY